MTSAIRRRVKHAVFVGGGLVVVSFLMGTVPSLSNLERASRDWRYRHFNRNREATQEVVVVDIDEQSLKIMAPHFGRWPWPRRVYKELLSFLAMGEPRVVLFDVLFTEKMLGTTDDRTLFEFGHELANISHGINLLEERADGEKGMGLFPKGFPSQYGQTGVTETIQRNQKTFQDAVVHDAEFIPFIDRMHVATFREDSDGVFRRAPTLFKLGDAWLPSLALASLKLSQTAKIEMGESLIIQDNDRVFTIPLDEDGLMPIHYYQVDQEPKSISIAGIFDSYRHLQLGEELAKDAISPFEFKDKVVIVGASAVGLSDLKITPIRSAYPGALVQATAVANLLSQDFLKRVPNWLVVIIAIVVSAATYLAVLFFESFVIKIGVTSIILGIYSALSIKLFQHQSLDVGLFMPIFVAGFGIVEAFIYLGVVEGREKRRMQSTLSKYLSPEVTKKLIESGVDPHAEDGRQDEVTILFTDIRSFTTISEAFAAPIVVGHLNNYLGKMTEIIFDESGTLDKFVGDAIMAFWGAPLKNERHAEFAVRCALKMQRAVHELRLKVGVDSPFAFKTGIGINSGNVVVGNIGSNKRLDYTVIGDNVNLAARIESVTKDFRSPILIGESTYNAVKDIAVCRLVDEHVQIKGKLQYIKLFQPLCMMDEPEASAMKEFSSAFENALKVYRAGEFKAAQKLFLKIDTLRQGTDGPSQLFRERCQYWIENPPEQWSGYDKKASH